MKRLKHKTLVIAIVLVAILFTSAIGNVMAGKPIKECNDDIDNDGDGDIDTADGGCNNPNDNDETNCGDGVCEGGEDSGSCPADCGTPDSCSDTDGGNFPWTFGTTSGYLNATPYSNDDYCADSSNVNEYYCAGDYETSQQQSCGTDGAGPLYCMNGSVYQNYTDYFCSGGACDATVTPGLNETCEFGCSGGACQPAPDSCSDTDGGNFPWIFGTTSGILNETPYSNNDYCADSSNVNEYYCIGDYETSQQQSCGTDGYSAPYCVNDSVYLNYTDYSCASGECDSNVTPVFNETCEFGCSAGACQPAPDSCSDTDGGFVPDIFGTTSGYLNNTPYSNDDYCASGNTVWEYYCAGNYETRQSAFCGIDSYGAGYCVNDSVYKDFNDTYCLGGACGETITPTLNETCQFGCSGGVCNDPPAPSCNDTDGGWFPETQGTVSGYLVGGTPYEWDDFCNGTTILLEYYCNGDDPEGWAWDCSLNGTTSCVSGACV